MKKLTVLLLPLALLALSCGTDRAARDAAAVATDAAAVIDVDFSELMYMDWMLSEIRTASETITLDRDDPMGFGDIFTLRFEGDMVFGRAMPNTYRGPYTLGENQALAFGLMATTMMATLVEPEGLNEHQFFVHLGNVTRWGFADGNLELHAIDEYSAEAILVFVPQGN